MLFLSVKLSSIATYDSQMWPLREVHYILTWTLQQVEDNLLLPYQIFSSCSAEHLNIKDDKISVNFAKASSQSTPKPKGKKSPTADDWIIFPMVRSNFENSSIKILIHLTYFRIFKSDLKWPREEIIHCRNLIECYKSLKLLMRMCVTILSLTSETDKQTIKREKLKSAQ